ncbi:MAG TPA: S8 family serine peptidase, partial [Candidatus Sumerlaeota bacterium]|nr:S8 family serine peptidase [Candidatus Sumerlaeota bacterium]
MKTQCQILKESVGALMRLILFRALLCVFALPCALWARELFEPGQVIVRYKTIQECGTGDTKGSVRIHSSASLERLDRQFGLLKAENPRQVRQAVVAERKGSVPASNAVQWRVLTFSAKSDARAIAAAYAKDPAVAYAEPNYIGTLGHVPTDPAYSGKQQTHFAQMKLEQAWDIQQGDPSVIVAVIDSGVDINHPDLAGAIAPGGWDFVNATSDITDLLGHGTRVAGIIAASENGEGGVGAAFGCRILPFAVGNDRGQVLLSDLVAAIEEAVAQGAKVINLSLSFRFRSQLLDEAVAAAAKSAVVVAGVGNDGQGDSPRYPASCPQVLGVGAVDQDGGCAIFSNFNGGELTLVDLVAPGVEVYSPTPGGGWNAASGTSFSTPFVSAVAALLRAYQPEQSPEAIMRHLKKTASRQSEFGKHGAFWSHRSRVFRWGMGSWFDYDREQGDGLANPYAALATPMIPVLSVRAVSVVDDPLFSATNDGDGELDQSEKVRLRLEITCEENDALNLALRLSCTDERIALVDNAGEPVPEIQVSRSALRCGETAALAFSYIEVAPTAGRGEVPFSLAASDRDGALPDLAFNIMIENKVPVSGPKPDIHFTNDYAYIVEDDLTLSGVCLIDPGTPFSVHPGKKITLSAGGSLTAVGEAEAPILFRSIYDIPDLSLVPATQDGPIAGLSDPHNVGLLGGMTVEELEAQCGPKTVQVNLGDYHQIRHVSANTGSDTTGNGSSANPWQSIQYGLEQILDADTSNRYALFVAEGTYSNTKATTGTAVVIMKEWVDLWGGFDPSSWTRDIEAHVSIIDGSGDNPHRCVNGADNARIDGFTITGGHVTDGDDS